MSAKTKTISMNHAAVWAMWTKVCSMSNDPFLQRLTENRHGQIVGHASDDSVDRKLRIDSQARRENRSVENVEVAQEMMASVSGDDAEAFVRRHRAPSHDVRAHDAAQHDV